MGFAVAYNPCGWCPYKESGERCGMCELEFRRKEWISVEERLPEPNEKCLVSARVGDRVVIDLGEIVQYWNGRPNDYGFMWMITNDWDEGEGCEITHWMPLPEPPVMKGGE